MSDVVSFFLVAGKCVLSESTSVVYYNLQLRIIFNLKFNGPVTNMFKSKSLQKRSFTFSYLFFKFATKELAGKVEVCLRCANVFVF